jgi:hypothetical protein
MPCYSCVNLDSLRRRSRSRLARFRLSALDHTQKYTHMIARNLPEPRFFSRPWPKCMCAKIPLLPDDSSMLSFRPRGGTTSRVPALVRGLREVMDHIHQRPDMIDGGLWENSMAEVEYVTGPAAGLLEDAPGLPLNFR